MMLGFLLARSGVDVRCELGETPLASRDTDFFTGSTARQQAGFDTAPISPPLNLARDEAFITHPDLLVSGQFQSSPFDLPDMIDGQKEAVGRDGTHASFFIVRA